MYAAAFILAHYLSLHPELVENKVLLELGCGTGLTSIAGAMRWMSAGTVIPFCLKVSLTRAAGKT